MTDIGNCITFKYDDGQIGYVIERLHSDAAKTLGQGVAYEIRRKAFAAEISEYKEAMSDFNPMYIIEAVTPEKLNNNFGVAWVSNEGMQSMDNVSLDLSAKYDKAKNYALMGRFACWQ